MIFKEGGRTKLKHEALRTAEMETHALWLCIKLAFVIIERIQEPSHFEPKACLISIL